MPLVMSAGSGWTRRLDALLPGDHAAVLTRTYATGLVGRLAGLELRDTLLVLRPGPATGFVFLFRKPLDEPTVAAQMLATGTGGLHINACRIGGVKQATAGRRTVRWGVGEGGSSYEKGTGAIFTNVGRWPPNVLFIHADTCRRTGERRVQGNGHWPSARGAGGLSTSGHGGQDGLTERHAEETVAAWECALGCPVPALDNLSGPRPSTLTGRAEPTGCFENPGDNHGTSLFGGGNSRVYADDGGASRFYPQFANFDALLTWLSELVGCA